MVVYEYSQHRKRLRVTSPRNGQRSTYFLGVPYSYGIPLLVISNLFHWMFSWAFFLVNIKFLDYRGRPRLDPAVVSEARFVDEDINQCGYSPIAVIFSTVVSSIILIVGLLNGLRRYDSTARGSMWREPTVPQSLLRVIRTPRNYPTWPMSRCNRASFTMRTPPNSNTVPSVAIPLGVQPYRSSTCVGRDLVWAVV